MSTIPNIPTSTTAYISFLICVSCLARRRECKQPPSARARGDGRAYRGAEAFVAVSPISPSALQPTSAIMPTTRINTRDAMRFITVLLARASAGPSVGAHACDSLARTPMARTDIPGVPLGTPRVRRD